MRLLPNGLTTEFDEKKESDKDKDAGKKEEAKSSDKKEKKNPSEEERDQEIWLKDNAYKFGFIIRYPKPVSYTHLCVLCALVFGGYRDGFLLKLLSILSFFVCGFLAWWASSYVGSFIHLYPKHALPLQDTPLEAVLYDNLNRLLIFVILFVLLQLAVLVIKPFTKAANHVPVVSGINRLLGAALGALQAVLLMVLAAMVCRLPFWKTGRCV